MPTTRLTPELIAAAIDGYVLQRTRIDEKIAELRSMISGNPEAASVAVANGTRKRTISPAGRARIAEAQRRRWAEAKGVSPAAAPARRKRRLSAAGRAAIVAAAKKRWALKRAQAGA